MYFLLWLKPLVVFDALAAVLLPSSWSLDFRLVLLLLSCFTTRTANSIRFYLCLLTSLSLVSRIYTLRMPSVCCFKFYVLVFRFRLFLWMCLFSCSCVATNARLPLVVIITNTRTNDVIHFQTACIYIFYFVLPELKTFGDRKAHGK